MIDLLFSEYLLKLLKGGINKMKKTCPFLRKFAIPVPFITLTDELYGNIQLWEN